MTIPRSKTKLGLLLLLVGGVAAGVGACSYDWTVGVAAPADSGLPDATTLQDAAPEGDAQPEASPPPSDAGTDAPTPDASTPPCAQLQKTLDDARNAAKVCSGPASGQCTTGLFDECGCLSYVADADSGTANAFAAAVGSFETAGCTASCGDAGCVSVVGSCLPLPGSVYACN